MAHRVVTQQKGGGTVYQIRDEQTGASASILPAHGFNLFDLRLPVAVKVLPMVYAADDWADNPGQGGPNGTPVMFPFPNRIRAAGFEFQGRTYALKANSGGNAIHGFAGRVAWDVTETQEGAEAASVTGIYQIGKHSPEALGGWPTDAMLQIRYTLSGRRLELEATVMNPTDLDLPYGFGIHPYYRLPFTSQGAPERTRVVIPARQYWVLEQFLPTGQRLPVDQRLDFREGQAMSGLALDDVLTDLDGDPVVCRLVDESLPGEFQIRFGPPFREVVVYTPPRNPGVIAIEPYTQTTDAINLASRGIAGGLRVLKHGQQEVLKIAMETVG